MIKLHISAEVKIGKIQPNIQLEWYILDTSLSQLFIWSWKDKYVYTFLPFQTKTAQTPYPLGRYIPL